MANVCKHNVTKLIYEIDRLAQDIGGGITATMPSEADLRSPRWATGWRSTSRAWPASPPRTVCGWAACWRT